MQALKTTERGADPRLSAHRAARRGGFGEVWKCEAPGGLFKAIKFVYGDLQRPRRRQRRHAEQELHAAQRIKAIRHPFLLSMDRVEIIDGELLIVMELADRNLHDLLARVSARRPARHPRDELLGYLPRPPRCST